MGAPEIIVAGFFAVLGGLAVLAAIRIAARREERRQEIEGENRELVESIQRKYATVKLSKPVQSVRVKKIEAPPGGEVSLRVKDGKMEISSSGNAKIEGVNVNGTDTTDLIQQALMTEIILEQNNHAAAPAEPAPAHVPGHCPPDTSQDSSGHCQPSHSSSYDSGSHSSSSYDHSSSHSYDSGSYGSGGGFDGGSHGGHHS